MAVPLQVAGEVGYRDEQWAQAGEERAGQAGCCGREEEDGLRGESPGLPRAEGQGAQWKERKGRPEEGKRAGVCGPGSLRSLPCPPSNNRSAREYLS